MRKFCYIKVDEKVWLLTNSNFRAWKRHHTAGQSGNGKDLRNEISFACREQNDLQLAMFSFDHSGAVDVNLMACRIGVLDGELAASANLKSIVKHGSSIKPIVAEAGAGIVNLKKLHRSAGAVFDDGVDVVGVASGDKGGDRTKSQDWTEAFAGQQATSPRG